MLTKVCVAHILWCVLYQSLVSGGVDSAVCTALLNAALGPENVVVVHIDNGFMRKNESDNVRRSLESLGLKPHGELGVFILEREGAGQMETWY